MPSFAVREIARTIRYMQRKQSLNTEHAHKDDAGDMSHSASPATRVAALLPTGDSSRDAFRNHVRRQFSPEAHFFHPKDQDELNDSLRNGRFDRVIFGSQEDLLNMIWNGHGDVGAWGERGVELVVSRSDASTAESLPQTEVGEGDAVRLIDMAKCFERWSAAQRRRQVIAATILSLIAIAALTVLFTLKPV